MRLSLQAQPTNASATARTSAPAPTPTILAMRRGTAVMVGLVLHGHAVEVVLVRHRRVVPGIQREVVRPDLERVGELDWNDGHVLGGGVGEDRRRGRHLAVD